MNASDIGREVLVYDRYRFAMPLRAPVYDLSTVNDGVQVELLQSNNPQYMIGDMVWVHAQQLLPALSGIVTDRFEIAKQMENTVEPSRDPNPPPAVKPGDWLASLSSAERKECAVHRGLFAYFPDALAAVARHSVRANEKHNPGQPIHWSRAKSSDHADCLGRHTLAVAANYGGRWDVAQAASHLRFEGDLFMAGIRNVSREPTKRMGKVTSPGRDCKRRRSRSLARRCDPWFLR